MDWDSSEILRFIKENDENLVDLCLGDGITYHKDGIFNSSVGSDFTTLGQYVATNTHLEMMMKKIMTIYSIQLCVLTLQCLDNILEGILISPTWWLTLIVLMQIALSQTETFTMVSKVTPL